MRRPHVYQRSAPRARRDADQVGSSSYEPAARAAIAVLPELLILTEAVGAANLTRYLGQALSEAERIVRWAP